MELRAPIPILRSFDEAKAKAFYRDYLGFRIDWEHRFEPALPLYMQVSRDACVLHISEHHGDAAPGSAVRIEVAEIDALHRELSAKGYRNARPRVADQPWGRDMDVIDPFANRLTFSALRRE